LVAGLETRIGNFNEEVKSLEDGIVEKKNVMKDAAAAIKKYEGTTRKSS
jgi:uncharacterized small protein (DUF1192 family)